MALVDDVLATLPFLREQAESLMLDTCTVERMGEPQLDENTGGLITPATRIYEGKCKLQATLASASTPEAGEHQFTVQDIRFDLPVSAGPIMVDDVVTVTAATLDSQLVGRKYRVAELFHKTLATAQRMRAEEVPA